MIKGVIFDFNGTLFIDNDKHIKAWSEISNRLRNRPITEKELHENMNGCPNHLIVQYLMETSGNKEKLNPELVQEYSEKKEELYREFCREDVQNFHLIKGAEDLFNDLQAADVPFTIATASIKPNVDFFIKSFGLDRWIDPDKIVYDDGTYENKEAMFKKAAENIGMQLKDLTVIEDSLAGVKASLADGIEDIRIINSGNIADQVRDLPQVKQILNDMTLIER